VTTSQEGTRDYTLIVLGGVEALLLVVLAWMPAAHVFPWPGLLVFGSAFAVYALAARHVGRAAHGRDTDDGAAVAEDGDGALTLRTIWLVAIAMRVALLPLAPELTDDFYRYLWDGSVQLAGTNPYLYAPGAAEMEGLRTAQHHLINNPDVPTIYPPLAQIVFYLIALGGSSIVFMKVLWLACDLGTAWVITRIARARGRDPALPLILYAWAPLLVVEVAWSGHLEPLGLLMMSLAIWAATVASAGSGAPLASLAAGSALALSALTKFAPAVALPALVRRLGWRALVGFGATIAILYLPYLSAGEALFTGLRTYSEHWWFMKGAFAVLEAVTGDPLMARRAAAVIVIGVIGWATLKRFDLERTLLWALGAGMTLTPTLHPWYVLWMLPMAALRTNRPFLLLGGLAFIGYFGLGAYQSTGEWIQPAAVRAALWVPFFIMLGVDGWRDYGHTIGKQMLAKRG